MPQYHLTTPEQVRFRFEVAGLVSRAMGWLVDQLILWTLRLALIFALAPGGHVGVAVVMVLIFVLDFGYYAYFELRHAGQSPGKRAFGLRVIAASGARLGFAEVMIRNLLRALDTLPYLMMLGGAVAMADRWHRRLGDLAAETLVVRDVRAALPEPLRHASMRDNSYYHDPRIRQRILSRLTRPERDLLFELMLRRDDLEPVMRETIFTEAASYFRDRFALPTALDHLSDEQTVLNLALVAQSDTPTPTGATRTGMPAERHHIQGRPSVTLDAGVVKQ